MIPKDLNFDFSSREDHIKNYVAEINSFFEIELYRENDPSALYPTYVSM